MHGGRAKRRISMEYLFVWSKNGGWYLKIDSIEKLTDYYERTLQGKYDGAIQLYTSALSEKKEDESVLDYFMHKPLQERIALMSSKDFQFMYAAIMKAGQQEGATFLDGFRFINFEMAESDMKDIKERGAVYFNPVGGKTYGVEYNMFVHRKNLVFPCYGEQDIRISQFEGGTHYYAYIGDAQIRKNDTTKWHTFEEAYEQACQYITEE